MTPANDSFELELTTMAHGGSALGRHDGKTIFVPYTIPGERIEARVTQDKGRIAFAEGVRLLDASADRVFPRCPHFGPGRCWSCQWQHIAYPAQLLLKQDVLADQLARLGGFEDADVRAVIASPAEWGYNYHMTFTVSPQGELGFPTADGRVFPISECHILHPDLLALYHALDLEAGALAGITRLTLALGADGAHMLIVSVASEEDAPDLLIDLPTSVNMLLPDNEPVNLIGESHLRYSIGGQTFRVTAGSSFRANIAQVEPLAQLVLDALALTGGENVLDLYAGVGLFSGLIAPHAALVTLVESYPPAVTDADENLADFENVDVYEGAVEAVLDSLEDRYDAAVIDPPSEGLTTDALDALIERDIPRLVYVSSDPAALARDAKRLTARGYTLDYVQPIDLSPHTYYIDAVARFQR